MAGTATAVPATEWTGICPQGDLQRPCVRDLVRIDLSIGGHRTIDQ